MVVEGTSYMFVTGPNVVKTVTHEDVDVRAARRGLGARLGAQVGVAHCRRTDEPEAIAGFCA